MEQLTKTQQDLISDLVKEFTKINPTKDNDNKRFSIATINECLNEEEHFYKTIAKHNVSMIDMLVGEVKKEVVKLKKEFGKVFDIKFGHKVQRNDSEERYTLEKMVDYNKSKYGILRDNYSTDTRVMLVSNTKNYPSFDNNYFGKAYCMLFLSFKREKVSMTLTSGATLVAYKVVGLNYSNRDWSSKDLDTYRSYPSLDELIQNNQQTQQAIINLVK
jgi:hypothetical protein